MDMQYEYGERWMNTWIWGSAWVLQVFVLDYFMLEGALRLPRRDIRMVKWLRGPKRSVE